jgi:hypothetical protein
MMFRKITRFFQQFHNFPNSCTQEEYEGRNKKGAEKEEKEDKEKNTQAEEK